ncbi:DNA-binding transcription factor, zf-fungal binuclear cluster type Gsf1 [Schizosaccharomyces pombe]|uniref:Uncharacterized transcriptional regulatory protein C15D4.02 n=1 Tax=Schizosaccharomyces pombe (strain 972 / ATCC 24843) TaxID=284812 RepID=YOG2_SCHPO|nr:putative transcription factor [Schizosaccharomyces pombe]O74308.3 RecName: Full=Uncharacterized transcriptional regulatory protein C15D4.02 [Schizosaccharomyces pombe 972h-]CAA20477.3 transcription factor, zf-fungal binuclear cluster type (predicted) [Schizosaccharomyces pombe]|eukprot:NP_596242.3 putative transcription factor [Schizosaccharomyces pombe]
MEYHPSSQSPQVNPGMESQQGGYTYTYQQPAPPNSLHLQHPSILTRLPPLSSSVVSPSLASLPPFTPTSTYHSIAALTPPSYPQSSSAPSNNSYTIVPSPHDPSNAYSMHHVLQNTAPQSVPSPSPIEMVPPSPPKTGSNNSAPVTGKTVQSGNALNNSGLVKRQARKRTKTGCLTCRKRRIKCDERKPICYNCIKSKRQCEGYTHFPRPSGTFTASRRIPVSSLLSEPAPHGLAGQPTHPTFLYYIQSVAPSLCLWDACHFPPLSPYSSFSSIYWSSTVPELALRNPNISVALYAFASAKRHLTDDAVAFARQARVALTNITTTDSLLILVLLAVTQLYIPKSDIQLFNFAVDQVVKFDASLMTSPSDEIITYLLRRMFIRQVVLAGIVKPLASGLNPLPLLKCDLPPATTPTAVLDESLFHLGLRKLCHEKGLEPEFTKWSKNCPIDKADLPRLALLMIHAVFTSPVSLAQWVELILQNPDPTPAIHIARACLLAVHGVVDLGDLQMKVEKCVQSCEERQLQATISNFSTEVAQTNSSALAIGCQ